MKIPFFTSKNKTTTQTAAENVVEIKQNFGTEVLLGSALLQLKKEHLLLVKQTQNNVSCTKEVWTQFYLPIIAKTAELIQLLPASERYHHDYLGGLLVHTLEVMKNATQISTSYILPPDTEPEDIVTHAQRWRAGIIVCALLHDVGKLLVDVEVMITTDGKKYQRFYPLFDAWPVGSFYRSRYAPKKKGHTKALHERSALLAFNKIVNRKMFTWFCEDPVLLQQMLDTLTYSADSKNLVAEIIIKADMASVKKAIGNQRFVEHTQASSKASTNNQSLPEAAFTCIRKAIVDGEIKVNQKGAMLWRTAKYSFFMAKPIMELALTKLRQLDFPNLPKESDKLQMLMANEGFVKKSVINESDIVWLMQLTDFTNGWQQNFTMLVMDNEQLDITDVVPVFDGELVLLERGKDKNPTEVKFTSEEAYLGQYQFEENIEEKSTTPIVVEQETETTSEDKEPESNIDTLSQTDNQQETETKQSKNVSTVKPELVEDSSIDEEFDDTHLDKIEVRGITNAELRAMHKQPIEKKLETLKNNAFFDWLTTSIQHKKIKINQQNSPIHIVDDYVLLVTPAIFRKYLKNNIVREKRYAVYNNNAPFSAVQHEFDSLKIHEKSNGSNHTRVRVEGAQRKSQLTVYKIKREYFPDTKDYLTNDVIRLE